MLIGCNYQTIWITNVGPLFDEVAFCIKNLDPLIFSIAHIDTAFLIDGHTVRQIEFTGTLPVFAPCLDVIPVTIKLDDSRIAVTIRHVDIAILRESHVCWLVEKPICLRAGINSSKDQQDIPGRVQFKDQVIAVVSRPNIVVRVYAQAMRMCKQSLANTLNEITLLIVFCEHWLCSLEQKYVPFGIHCNP